MSEMFELAKSLTMVNAAAARGGVNYVRDIIEREIMRLESEITRVTDAQEKDAPIEPGIYGTADWRELAFASQVLERIKKQIVG